jgi:phosphopantothenoylcysteine decarboxylase/phosphopantothenate--cysteine ligase
MKKKALRFLVVSGPTREPLDPVRYLSNYSTGRMGESLAAAVKKAGHKLEWVKCPADAETARELEKRLKVLTPRCDVLVMAAAVCDVRPKTVSGGKIKKSSLKKIEFVKNPDILAGLGRRKKAGQIFVGFALESAQAFRNGAGKLASKNLDLLLLQKVSKASKPFGDTKLEAWVLDRSGAAVPIRRTTKDSIARILVRKAEALA